MSQDNEVWSLSGRFGGGAPSLQFFSHVASGANIKDLNGNQINSVSKGSVSASTTVTGNYTGGTTGAGAVTTTINYVGWMQTSGAAAAETITLGGSAPSQTITLSASSTGTVMVAAM